MPLRQQCHSPNLLNIPIEYHRQEKCERVRFASGRALLEHAARQIEEQLSHRLLCLDVIRN